MGGRITGRDHAEPVFHILVQIAQGVEGHRRVEMMLGMERVLDPERFFTASNASEYVAYATRWICSALW